ncbi:MAG: homocysteine S-methyltransferase family protein, partial [Rhodospirillales bacterium]|nr:homocysteine S-methyltransferase family protein [Rhodospirillales bacterium]
MSKYRNHLPQLDGGLFLTDGGLETTLIFHDGLELPCFASFDLLREQSGRDLIRAYYDRYAAIAAENGVGFVLEAPTWRANADWGEKLGYSTEALAAANRESVELMTEVRDRFETPSTPMVISGCLGPRGDGYDPGDVMTADEAEAYHAEQIKTFRDTDADMISAMTLTNVPEAIGIVRAAQAAVMPVIISFTLETDGCLPTGQTLKEAIEAVDDATGTGPAYYMINCAHPSHFDGILDTDEAWIERIRAVRANASRRSHAELDEAEDLDDGDPVEFGAEHRDLRRRHGHINVFGGCCGTDHRH